MEVTFVVDYYPFFSGRVVYELVNRLRRFGVKATVISSSLLAEKQGPEPDVIRLKASHFSLSGTPYIRYNLHELHRLPNLSKETDIINLHFTIKPLPLYHGLLKKFHLMKSPVVATPHGLPTGYPSTVVRCVSSILFSFSEIFVLDDANAITTVSKKEYAFFRNKYPNKILEHIPNGVDTSVFRPDESQRQMIREKFQFTEDAVLVLYFTGLRTQKGILVFLDAIRNIMRKNMKIAFLVVGTGPLASHVQAFVATQGNPRIRAVTDFVPEEYVAHFYNACDIYVLPSCYEAMPLSLMEAMACGKPVIATPVGDVPLLVEEGINGFLVPPNDVNLLVARIVQLAENPETGDRMGKRNILKMRHYDWNKTAERYYHLYRKVLNQAYVGSKGEVC